MGDELTERLLDDAPPDLLPLVMTFPPPVVVDVGVGAGGAVGAGAGSSPPMIMSAIGLDDVELAGESSKSASSNPKLSEPLSADSFRGRVFLGGNGFRGARAMAKR